MTPQTTLLLAELLAQAQPFLRAAFLIFLRVGGVMALLPAFGEQSVPLRVRLLLGLGFTLVVLFAAPPGVPERLLPAHFLGEVGIGLFIGLMIRSFVLALQTAGAIIAQSISLSQLFGGTDGMPQPAVGNLLVLAGLAVSVHLGLHVKISALLIASYTALPPGQLPDAEMLRGWGVSGVAQSFALAFAIAMPFMLGGLVYNVALGAINRAMPQLMVAFIGAPALTLGGLVLLALALPSGLALWLAGFERFLAGPFGVLR